MKILVVDDEVAVSRGIARILREHEVVIATNADDVMVKMWAGERFDLIVSDLNMPGCNGSTMLAEVKAWLGTDAPMLVLMSGGGSGATTPVDATLNKPFAINELRAMVQVAFERKDLRSRAQTMRLPRVA